MAITVEELEIKIRTEYGDAINQLGKFIGEYKKKLAPLQGQVEKQAEQIAEVAVKNNDKIVKSAADTGKKCLRN